MAAKEKPKSADIYEWSGINKSGKKVNGEIPGTSLNEVKSQLRKQGVTPSKVKKKAKPLFAAGDKIEPADIAMVTRQVATMLSAGVSLIQTLEMIGKGHDKSSMRSLLGEIAHEVQAGNPLSTCLRKHPKYFDDLYCDLVASGEQSGSVETI